MTSSFLPLSLRLVAVVAVVFSTAAAVSSQKLQEACSGTEDPKLCVSTLSTFPESATADLKQLAGLAVVYAIGNGNATRTYVIAAAEKAEDPNLQQCLSDCTENAEDATQQLNTAMDMLSRGEFKDAKMVVNAAMMDITTCNEGCESAGMVKDPVAMKVKEKMDRWFDLISVALSLSKQLK